MWYELKGDKRLEDCTSVGCGGQSTWRLESGGVGSDYCSGCKETIEAAQLEAKYGTVVPGIRTPNRRGV